MRAACACVCGRPDWQKEAVLWATSQLTIAPIFEKCAMKPPPAALPPVCACRTMARPARAAAATPRAIIAADACMHPWRGVGEGGQGSEVQGVGQHRPDTCFERHMGTTGKMECFPSCSMGILHRLQAEVLHVVQFVPAHRLTILAPPPAYSSSKFVLSSSRVRDALFLHCSKLLCQRGVPCRRRVASLLTRLDPDPGSCHKPLASESLKAKIFALKSLAC